MPWKNLLKTGMILVSVCGMSENRCVIDIALIGASLIAASKTVAVTAGVKFAVKKMIALLTYGTQSPPRQNYLQNLRNIYNNTSLKNITLEKEVVLDAMSAGLEEVLLGIKELTLDGEVLGTALDVIKSIAGELELTDLTRELSDPGNLVNGLPKSIQYAGKTYRIKPGSDGVYVDENDQPYYRPRTSAGVLPPSSGMPTRPTSVGGLSMPSSSPGMRPHF